MSQQLSFSDFIAQVENAVFDVEIMNFEDVIIRQVGFQADVYYAVYDEASDIVFRYPNLSEALIKAAELRKVIEEEE
jgi:hypothetical protein